MDFFTTHDAPVAIKIDGTSYRLPRFLIPQLKEWAATLAKQQVDAAVQEIADEEQRARFRLYWSAPTIDVAYLLQKAATPDGADHVVRSQLAAASVPAATIDKVIALANPLQVRELAQELTQAPETLAKLGVSDDGKTTPLAPPPSGSGGSPETGAATGPASASPTPDSTPTD